MIKEFVLKNKIFFLVLFLFTLITPVYLLADDAILDYYPTTKASSTGSVVNVISRSGQPYKVVNYSGASYFIPNKTQGEFNSFLNKSPRYTFHATCGDGVCLPGVLLETPENCPADCQTPDLPSASGVCGKNT